MKLIFSNAHIACSSYEEVIAIEHICKDENIFCRMQGSFGTFSVQVYADKTPEQWQALMAKARLLIEEPPSKI